MSFVIAAYVVTIGIIAGYLATILARRRSVERQIEALSSASTEGGEDPRSVAADPSQAGAE